MLPIYNKTVVKNMGHNRYILTSIREDQFKLYLPHQFEEMKKWQFPDGFTWKQKVFHFGRNDKDLKLGICPDCGKRCVFNDNSFEYDDFCCGHFCINILKNKDDLFNTFMKYRHKIFIYFNDFVMKYKIILENKIKELDKNAESEKIISSPRNLFLFLNENVEHTCPICGKETEFYGWRIGNKYKGSPVFFHKTCGSDECYNKWRSILQIGENNSIHKMTREQRLELHKKQSETMKVIIENGEFTPNITNSWCRSKMKIKYKLRNEDIIREVGLRSSFEVLFLFQNLDKQLKYESLRIPYINSKNIKRIYITDFIDEENKIVYEIKPQSKTNSPDNILKMNALKGWCEENGYECKYITEYDLMDNMCSFSIDDLRYMDDEYREKFLKNIGRYKFFKI